MPRFRPSIFDEFDETNPQHIIQAIRGIAEEITAAAKQDPSVDPEHQSFLYGCACSDAANKLRHLALCLRHLARYGSAERNAPMDLEEVADAAELEGEIPPEEEW